MNKTIKKNFSRLKTAAARRAENTPMAEALWRAILALRNSDEARRFFRDLLTAPEIQEFSGRWRTVRLLAAEVPYLEISRQTGLSSTTIARIQRWRLSGRGGYRLMLKRLGDDNNPGYERKSEISSAIRPSAGSRRHHLPTPRRRDRSF